MTVCSIHCATYNFHLFSLKQSSVAMAILTKCCHLEIYLPIPPTQKHRSIPVYTCDITDSPCVS